ncbi:centrosomal protein of 95 kDa-like isoform X3 [Salvelinus namaycush]|uniref:Centrosomal protein of 95 kDa-like isoform X3 n=1 Tax=Salvelinus namaycush TaxID=8040 RepID=A0A8U0U149_SALNM|nr:centrosomal protein of 95 kDa-like isoform X3 [Salvelinus namaycush]
MGTQEDERDWVDVANDILSKCHINLRLRKVTDCNANVFVALYEVILGEKVPDYIAAPGSQEDDVHNIQSVIDSLALDYLQISLSHITGENIVRGDKESIKNLLEIFDGLLEYLTEQISEEESQNGDKEPNGVPVEDAPFPTGPVVPQTEEQMSLMERASQYSSVHSAVQSISKPSLHSWNAEETGSTNELILLGDSARTFTAKQEVEASSQALCPSTMGAPGTPGTQATLLREPLRSAIPLQPPYQTTPHRPDRAPGSGSQSPPANGLGSGAAVEQEAPAGTSQSPRPVADTVTNGVRSPAFNHSPVEREKSVSSQTKARLEEAKEQPEPTSVGPRRVLFRTQPDIHFLTLQDELEDRAPLDTEEEVEEETFTQQDSWAHRGQTGLSSSRVLEEEDCEEPLSWRRQRNRKAEQELHHMSEKLSRRLEELDLMLKRALGESGEPDEVKEVDKQSHHSDSVMECRRPPRRPTGTPRAPTSPCTRSLSPSPPRARRSLSGQLEGAAREAVSGGVTQRHTAARTRRRQLRHLQPQHKHRQLETAYEEELKVYEDRERAAMATERTRAHEAEREYREAILRDVPRAPKPSQVYTTAARHRSPRTRQPTPGRRRQDKTRRAPPMKVKDNDLLPLLLEEFPNLHLSPHALGRMWQQQLGQVDRLNASLSLDNQRQGPRTKLTSQVEEAQRRHNLLGEIIHKEQEHNRRLRDFKERIQQQKSTQNRLKEQRQQIARAKKYHGDYHVQLRARMMRARTKEERMFKQVFEEGLEVQKARLREQRAYAKEQHQEHQNKHRDQIQSMENYYKDQFSLLAETLAIERRDIQVRKKAQEKALQKMKRELRSKMEREIGELQEIIVQNDDDDYFHDLEVQRLRRRVQMASFQYNTSCLH